MRIGKGLSTGICLLLALAATPRGAAAAADIPVDLELVLMVDVSGSVDTEEAQLQRRGYAAALTSPAVIDAVQSGPLGRIAVTYIEWADDGHQKQIAGWTLLDGPESAKQFADLLEQAPISTAFWTAIGDAILFGTGQFEGNGFDAARKVIDISGDGYSNRGMPPGEARDLAVAAGVTINGLPILNTRPNPWGGLPPVDLDGYYTKHVIGGSGAFVQAAEDFRSFGNAVLSKLVREIASLPAPEPGAPRRLAALGARSATPAIDPAPLEPSAGDAAPQSEDASHIP